MNLSVHILDSAFGAPAADVAVILRERAGGDQWSDVVRDRTGQDGWLDLAPQGRARPGVYQLICDLDAYYATLGAVPLHPRAIVEFRRSDPQTHLHLPMVISAHSFLSYRGN